MKSIRKSPPHCNARCGTVWNGKEKVIRNMNKNGSQCKNRGTYIVEWGETVIYICGTHVKLLEDFE